MEDAVPKPKLSKDVLQDQRRNSKIKAAKAKRVVLLMHSTEQGLGSDLPVARFASPEFNIPKIGLDGNTSLNWTAVMKVALKPNEIRRTISRRRKGAHWALNILALNSRPSAEISLAPTIDISPFLSQKSKLWKNDEIRSLMVLEDNPGMISLLAGRPNSSTFPFESITLKLKPTLAGLPSATEGADPLTLTIENEDLNEALQYGMTPGAPRLLDTAAGKSMWGPAARS
ncbi:hypothetical protein B0H16DRAFT_1699510 [Mycena metata]|uniref:Uncharacterized protein n=1 Tax=Mycena metata TaxID=1033252 RepID=A0AAD7HIZ2_9AGAR|nr:hypothetical protein B0H16DRAFT_1699510 [Mycena metata]